jgi:pyrimidine-nucleoside phosphorylase
VLSKKLAEGSEGLVIDVKWGNGSFIKDLEQAKQLARSMTRVGRSMKRRCVALVTDMNQPLGDTVGTSLEVKEAIALLKGEGPEDMKELVLKLGMEIVRLAGVAGSTLSAKQTVQRHLTDGSALEKFKDSSRPRAATPPTSTTRRNSRRRNTSASCPPRSAATCTPSTRR